MLSPLPKLGFLPCLLANSYSSLKTQVGGQLFDGPSGPTHSLHNSSFQPISVLTFITLQPVELILRFLHILFPPPLGIIIKEQGLYPMGGTQNFRWVEHTEGQLAGWSGETGSR